MSLADSPDSPGSPDPEGPAGQQAPVDPEHWLYRLTAAQWLQAAQNDLHGAQTAFLAKQQRAGVTYARRAAGMALNACLRLCPDPAYGRSYMDHLQALHKDPSVSQELRDAAGQLVSMPLTQQLVTLGKRGDAHGAAPAERILEYARAFVDRRAHPVRA
jgi:HEPN domain-containing protein